MSQDFFKNRDLKLLEFDKTYPNVNQIKRLDHWPKKLPVC